MICKTDCSIKVSQSSVKFFMQEILNDFFACKIYFTAKIKVAENVINSKVGVIDFICVLSNYAYAYFAHKPSATSITSTYTVV